MTGTKINELWPQFHANYVLKKTFQIWRAEVQILKCGRKSKNARLVFFLNFHIIMLKQNQPGQLSPTKRKI